ncbi:unnamed protein product [Protopolystoma xenopodis]|uniref:Protein kinase domain-containing protein n=1 Tax=Protopolystoma xenopodis TaxID=117903 RepID=A0A3S4ZXL3_9PLAT|nr:unnamed protein product [Protopolystoma xenopodis]
MLRIFLCNETCPPDKPRFVQPGGRVCLSEAEYLEAMGQLDAGQRSRRTVLITCIAVLVGLFCLVAIVAAIIVVYLNRKAEADKVREELRSAYTNLLEPDMKSQAAAREPNMGRLEMITLDDLVFDPHLPESLLGAGAFGAVYKGQWRVPKSAVTEHKWPRGTVLDVAIKVLEGTSSPSAVAAAQTLPTKASESGEAEGLSATGSRADKVETRTKGNRQSGLLRQRVDDNLTTETLADDEDGKPGYDGGHNSTAVAGAENKYNGSQKWRNGQTVSVRPSPREGMPLDNTQMPTVASIPREANRGLIRSNIEELLAEAKVANFLMTNYFWSINFYSLTYLSFHLSLFHCRMLLSFQVP